MHLFGDEASLQDCLAKKLQSWKFKNRLETGHNWGIWGSKANPCPQWDGDWFAPAMSEKGLGTAGLEIAEWVPHLARAVMLLPIHRWGGVSLWLCSANHGLTRSGGAREPGASPDTARSVKKLVTTQKHESSCTHKSCEGSGFTRALGFFHSSLIFAPSRCLGRVELVWPKALGASSGLWEDARPW